MRRSLPPRDTKKQKNIGAIAQLGERLLCTQEVGGSIPPGSTNFLVALLHEKDKCILRIGRWPIHMLFNNLEISDVLSG